MGLGLLGRGVGDAMFLAECGADLTVTDLKTKEQLASSLKQLSKFKNIKFVLGEHRLEDFRGRDMVVKAAGVPLDSIYIKEAKKNGIPVEMDVSLVHNVHVGDSGNDIQAAQAAGCAAVGVTYGYAEGYPIKTEDCDALVGGLDELARILSTKAH